MDDFVAVAYDEPVGQLNNKVMIIAWPLIPVANFGQRDQQWIMADTVKSEANSKLWPAKDMADDDPTYPFKRPMEDCGEQGSSRFPDWETVYLYYHCNRGCFVWSGKFRGRGLFVYDVEHRVGEK